MPPVAGTRDWLLLSKQPRAVHSTSDTDAGHGRIETRTIEVIDGIDELRTRDRWAGLATVARVTTKAITESKGSERGGTRFYITSRAEPDPAWLFEEVRGH